MTDRPKGPETVSRGWASQTTERLGGAQRAHVLHLDCGRGCEDEERRVRELLLEHVQLRVSKREGRRGTVRTTTVPWEGRAGSVRESCTLV